VLIDVSEEGLTKGLALIQANFNRSRRLSDEQKAEYFGRMSGSTDYGALADCDLVVEAVFEDMATKKKIFAELDRVRSFPLAERLILLLNGALYGGLYERLGCFPRAPGLQAGGVHVLQHLGGAFLPPAHLPPASLNQHAPLFERHTMHPYGRLRRLREGPHAAQHRRDRVRDEPPGVRSWLPGGRLSALRVSRRKSALHGGFVWARGVLNGRKRRVGSDGHALLLAGERHEAARCAPSPPSPPASFFILDISAPSCGFY
jgi:hypothetical protein